MSEPSRSNRFWSRVASFAANEAGEAPAPVPDQPPAAVLDLLRRLGVALCQSGEAVDRVGRILEDVAAAYDARQVRFFVLPTGVFVRLQIGESATIDFSPGSVDQLRLDQIDALYRLVDLIRRRRVDVRGASTELDRILASRPRFGPLVAIAGTAVLTLGLGLLLNPTASAVPAYPALGVLVGIMAWWAARSEALALVLTVSTAFVVSWAAFEFAQPLLNANALDLVIPSLVTLLPGATLTIATVELSSGSIMSGSTRLVFGLERLLLLAFGIAMGAQLAGTAGAVTGSAAPLGPWAPWLGVLLLGFGHFYASSAPSSALVWLLLVLSLAYGVQVVSGEILGSLASCFVAGAVIVPVAYTVQERAGGPPAQVTFLPAFWLLVPGALGLEGVTEILSEGQAAGIADFLNALLSIVAIAIGVLVGSAVTDSVGRRTSSWRGL
ncbi:threonine/serine ThrE exporter family protein [Marmoricola sp. RAF53]|uniref:threonine/serine ThrE exporter family protein n=1 Tax=Marmoricola sp. RAF53 TaxID=3233059 RepID=UPI003F97E5B9